MSIKTMIVAAMLLVNSVVFAKVSTSLNVVPIHYKASLPIRTAPALISSYSVQSFKDWKNEKIQAANKKYDNSQKKTLSPLQQAEAKEAYDWATELTITDYVVGYLAKIPDQKKAIREASAQLSVEEVAELMTVYANALFTPDKSIGTPSVENKIQATNLK
ncbi:MAG: hypothetical protein ACOYOK_14520 [Pseudobdellovibrionaceae bacterium]